MKQKQSPLEQILHENSALRKDIAMLTIALEDAHISKSPVLCYCISTPAFYDAFCTYLIKENGIHPEAVFSVTYGANDTLNVLENYFLATVEKLERAPGDIVFVQARGFVDLISYIPHDDPYALYRSGHDYDQMAREDFFRNLGRFPLKPFFALTHIDTTHEFSSKAIKAASASQFKLFIFELNPRQ